MQAQLAKGVKATVGGVLMDLSGVTVDLAGAKALPGNGELFGAIVSGGDADKDGNPDVTVATFVHIPVVNHTITLEKGPLNIPADKAFELLAAAAQAATPIPGVGVAVAGVIRAAAMLLRMALGKFL